MIKYATLLHDLKKKQTRGSLWQSIECRTLRCILLVDLGPCISSRWRKLYRSFAIAVRCHRDLVSLCLPVGNWDAEFGAQSFCCVSLSSYSTVCITQPLLPSGIRISECFPDDPLRNCTMAASGSLQKLNSNNVEACMQTKMEEQFSMLLKCSFFWYITWFEWS